LYAQNQRVLVVPYTRFQFVSEFTLDEIASYNNINSEEVFAVYQNSLIETFTSFNDSDVTFLTIKPEAYFEVKKFIRYNIDKFNGRKYNASNITLLPDNEFKTLLDKHNASHIMFINWYNISKSVHTVYIGDRNKRTKFSTHTLDYDVYNQEKIKVLGKGNVKVNCGDFPSESMINHKSLNTNELSKCYSGFIKELVQNLNSITLE
jgi:hypothetical protein